jgi:hypothetical protein
VGQGDADVDEGGAAEGWDVGQRCPHGFGGFAVGLGAGGSLKAIDSLFFFIIIVAALSYLTGSYLISIWGLDIALIHGGSTDCIRPSAPPISFISCQLLTGIGR